MHNYIVENYSLHGEVNYHKPEQSFLDNVNEFVLKCEQIYIKYMDLVYPDKAKDGFIVISGVNFYTVRRVNLNGSSALHCYISTNNGDIIASRNDNDSSKVVIGNIFNDNQSIDQMCATGYKLYPVMP